MKTLPALAAARSFLFLPGDRLERLPKALTSGAHAVILDLEDSVAPDAKAAAREAIRQAWQSLAAEDRPRLMVRINAVGTAAHDQDMRLLETIAREPLGGVVLPKSDAVAPLARVVHACGMPVMPLVESAEGLHALDLLARVPGVLRLAFGHLDFQADLGLQCGADEAELNPVRLAFTLASRRGGLPPPVDGVTVALDDAQRLAADVARSRRFGFGAKLCIHPRQVACVNEQLGPTEAQLAWARRVLDAAAARGNGAFRLDGEMIDAPVLRRARSLLGT